MGQMIAAADEHPRGFDATIGLGSNIGDKIANIDEAIGLLTQDGAIRLVGKSKLYRSAPWGVLDQDWFVNACISVRTDLAPHELLRRCQNVEQAMGRVRLVKWGARIIDVDILTYRDMTLRAPDLVIPHPFISQRTFVLVPLRDIAPDLTIDGRTLTEMIAALGGDDVVPVSEG
jgi:2-amino-4-hydroxy-6-hydroxymethyldihydropteridine diphosphokinase